MTGDVEELLHRKKMQWLGVSMGPVAMDSTWGQYLLAKLGVAAVL